MAAKTPTTAETTTNPTAGVNDAETFPLTTDPETPTENPTVATATPTANGTPAKKAKPAAKSTNPAGRPAPLALPSIKEPAGTEKTVPLAELVFDKRLQNRVSVHDEATVEKYADIYRENPDALPPIKAIEVSEKEAEELKLPGRVLVWDGFQRGEARSRSGQKNIRVIVAPGTFDTARLLSLGANSKHGLPRTSADMRKAFVKLVDDAELLEKVLKLGVNKGGAVRALAGAANCSNGMAVKILKEMGVTARGDKLVKRPAQDETPTRHTRAGATADPAAGIRTESKDAIKTRATATLIKEMQYSAAQLQRRYEELLTREDVKNIFREQTQRAGVPLTLEEGAKKGERAEFWPAVDNVLLALDETADQHSKLGVSK